MRRFFGGNAEHLPAPLFFSSRIARIVLFVVPARLLAYGLLPAARSLVFGHTPNQVAPVARADPLVCDMAPPRLGYMLGNFRAMDMVKREAPEKLKVGTVSECVPEGVDAEGTENPYGPQREIVAPPRDGWSTVVAEGIRTPSDVFTKLPHVFLKLVPLPPPVESPPYPLSMWF